MGILVPITPQQLLDLTMLQTGIRTGLKLKEEGILLVVVQVMDLCMEIILYLAWISVSMVVVFILVHI